MMRHIFVQISHAKQQLQNFALLSKIPRSSHFRKRIQSDLHIGKKPLQRSRIDQITAPAFFQRGISPRKSLIQKVIEAQRLSSKRRRQLRNAIRDSAVLDLRRRHGTTFCFGASHCEWLLKAYKAGLENITTCRRKAVGAPPTAPVAQALLPVPDFGDEIVRRPVPRRPNRYGSIRNSYSIPRACRRFRLSREVRAD